MAGVTRGRGARKRPIMDLDPEPASKSPKVILINPSMVMLEIPSETNTTMPVWDAIRSQKVSVVWTVSPHSICVAITPTTNNQNKGTSVSTQTEAVAIAPNQVSIRSLPQSGVQNNHCVVLTLAQNNTQTQSIVTPGTSVLVTLPLIITSPQPTPRPSTSGRKSTQPTPQSSIPTPPKIHFHTRSASDVEICDNFLINTCSAGEECPMHHTQYPFHWQLWRISTHQWIDIPPHGQILLEKIYCNVSETIAHIRDGKEKYVLDFESMELDDPSKYDGVRRLANSESSVKNPHFPAKMQFYWWNNYEWELYTKKVSELLLKKMKQKASECHFQIDSKNYKVNFTTMKQTNVSTGFERDVRCRPLYRSLDSMLPYLKTNTPDDPNSELGNFSVDALKDFTSWYPPVWSLVPEQDYSLVNVPAGTKAYSSVLSLFFEGIAETRVDIVSVQQVQNLLHWDKYQRHKMHLMKKYPKLKEPLERHLFHGTTKDAIEGICQNNFDPRLAGLNGASFGYGTYFAINPTVSENFAKISDKSKDRYMFLAKVLVGKYSQGHGKYRRPPLLKHSEVQHALYDSCTDSLPNPTQFVIFDSCQCYPYYLIRYRDMPNAVAFS